MTIFFIIGCDERKFIIGTLLIDKYYSEYNILTNGLLIEPDGTCNVPLDSAVSNFKTRGIGTWEYGTISEKEFIIIKCGTPLFSDTFWVEHKSVIDNGKGYDKIKMMELKSRKIYLYCSGFQM